MSSLGIVILAAGKGTRMQSKTQKILHQVGGKPMVQHAFEAAEDVADSRPVLVVGPGETGVEALLGNRGRYVVQAERLGTGHATRMAEPMLRGHTDQVIVTYADMPLLRPETLRRLAETQATTDAAVAMLSVIGDPASSFGRIVRDAHGHVIEICEAAEARRRPNADEILAIRELNAGVYCFSAEFLWHHIHNLPLRQARSGQEYYLTDLIAVAVAEAAIDDAGVVAIPTDDPDECLGAGTRAELVLVEKAFRRRTANRWLVDGVTLIDPDTTYIDTDVEIGQDTVIWPNSYLQGTTIIGPDCTIGPSAVVRDVVVAPGTVVPPFTVLEP